MLNTKCRSSSIWPGHEENPKTFQLQVGCSKPLAMQLIIHKKAQDTIRGNRHRQCYLWAKIVHWLPHWSDKHPKVLLSLLSCECQNDIVTYASYEWYDVCNEAKHLSEHQFCWRGSSLSLWMQSVLEKTTDVRPVLHHSVQSHLLCVGCTSAAWLKNIELCWHNYAFCIIRWQDKYT